MGLIVVYVGLSCMVIFIRKPCGIILAKCRILKRNLIFISSAMRFHEDIYLIPSTRSGEDALRHTCICVGSPDITRPNPQALIRQGPG
jgi:hypothetical protein